MKNLTRISCLQPVFMGSKPPRSSTVFNAVLYHDLLSFISPQTKCLIGKPGVPDSNLVRGTSSLALFKLCSQAVSFHNQRLISRQ
jgi:hypothetical protein